MAQHKLTHRSSQHTEVVDDAALKALQGRFTGRQRFADLYDVQEVKEPKKPEPLADDAPAKVAKNTKADSLAGQ